MRLVEIDALYAKLVREYPLQEELNELYIIQWVKEALPKIDNYDQWERKEYVLKIDEYRAVLPDDFYSFDYKAGKPAGRIQGGDFYTGMRKGTIRIHYLAFAMDNNKPNKRPLIPASEDYMDALMHYCASKMCKNNTIQQTEFINQDKEYQKWIDKKLEARADAFLSKMGEDREEISDNFNTFGVWQTRPEWPREDY